MMMKHCIMKAPVVWPQPLLSLLIIHDMPRVLSAELHPLAGRAAEPAPTTRPRSKTVRTPRTVWTSPILGNPTEPPQAPQAPAMDPANHAAGMLPLEASPSLGKQTSLGSCRLPIMPITMPSAVCMEGPHPPTPGPRKQLAQGPSGAPTIAMSPASITDGPHPPNTPAQPTRPALDAILAKRAVATLNIINSLGANDGRAGVVSSVGGILAQKFTGHPCPEAAG